MERVIKQISFPIANQVKLKRVAAYARVSTGKDAMLHSLSAQVSYYSDYIQSHKGWIYAGVYTDDGDIIITNEEIPLIIRVSGFVIIFFCKPI